MTEKIQKIKEEVERLKNHTLNIQKSKDGFVTSVGQGRVEAFNDILQFIDSLPEEHASEDLEKEIGKYTTNHLLKKRNHSTGVYHLTQKDCDDIARHFAEWQKKKDQETIELAEDHAMLAGMNKIKEEMMKDAVETIIVNDWQYGKDPDHAVIPAIHQRIDGFNVGDKVRIIIVKTEQQ